ncbi:MAG: BON domain-containing protein [Burkholderiaceae bacterium]|nr:MAG: BON domain-containing protein [Burkholderiaceae bacterium]
MKSKLTMSLFLVGSLLGPVIAHAADSDTDRKHPAAFVKDSAITTKIKAKLAAEHMRSLAHIKVDTDKDGAVWLSGSAKTQADVDKAESIARDTEGVTTVKNDIKVHKEK